MVILEIPPGLWVSPSIVVVDVELVVLVVVRVPVVVVEVSLLTLYGSVSDQHSGWSKQNHLPGPLPTVECFRNPEKSEESLQLFSHKDNIT